MGHWPVVDPWGVRGGSPLRDPKKYSDENIGKEEDNRKEIVMCS